MDSVTIFSCAALLLSLLYTVLIFLKKTQKKEGTLPPSPPSLPILGHLHLLYKPLYQSLAGLSAKHGPLLFLHFGTRPVVLVSSAELAEECLNANDIAFANRPRLPSRGVASYNFASLGTSNYGPRWREMRRIAAVELFSSQRLAFFADVRAQEARNLAKYLFRDTAVGGFTRVELRPLLFGLAMNIVMRMMFDKRYFGEEEGGEEARRFKEMTEELLSLGSVSTVGDFLPGALGWVARRSLMRRLTRFASDRDKLLQALVEDRRRARIEGQKKIGISNKTLIDALLALQNDLPDQYNNIFINSLVTSLIVAGTETLSIAIEWAMSLLLNNPDKLSIARKEIDEKVGHDRVFQESDLANLIYLHCIIKETLRLYPVVPLLLPHESAKECKVGGYDIPQGTMLLVNTCAIQRDANNWPEPNKFLPERFLGKEVGKMLPFGMGRRGCPGEGLAMKVMGLVLGTLLQCFDWSRVDDEEVDLKEGFGMTMPKATPLTAVCSSRQSMIAVLSQL